MRLIYERQPTHGQCTVSGLAFEVRNTASEDRDNRARLQILIPMMQLSSSRSPDCSPV